MTSCKPLACLLLGFPLLIGLGACARTERTPSRLSDRTSQDTPRAAAANRYQLAILPWNVYGDHEDVSTAIPNGKAALERALGGSDFVPIASYYDLDAYPVTRLQKNEVPKLRQMWRRASDGSNEPNLEVILPLGIKLGVDAMLLYAMEVNFGDDSVWVYLVDVARQTTYTSQGQVYDFVEDAYSELLGMTQYVFAQYTLHHGSKRVQ